MSFNTSTPSQNNQKIGVLGGSFDPIHIAHLRMAHRAFIEMRLEKVIFMPTFLSPFKPAPPQASDADRLQMLHLATQNILHFEVSDLAISRKSTSYCIDTVHALQSTYPITTNSIYWIIGSDLLPTLHLWKNFDELITLIQFIVVLRPDYPYTISHPQLSSKLHPIQLKPMDTSSTQIRSYLKTHNYTALEDYLPVNVIRYIKEHHLYGA